MTRIFTEDGVSIPVTVIEIENNRVTQVKDPEKDGYRAIQVTTGSKKSEPCTGNLKQVILLKLALKLAAYCVNSV